MKLYTANATSLRGREGQVITDDQKLSLKLSAPQNLIDRSGTNPEQLFACGYSACFGSALESVAKSEGITSKEVKVKASVALHKEEEKGYFLSVELEGTLEGVPNSTTKDLMKKAHQICPYSKAIQGNVEVKLKVNGEEIE